MNCSICNRLAPEEMDDVVQQRWIPDYYVGREQMAGPVCPDCIDDHLWLNEDGEFEARVPKKVAH